MATRNSGKKVAAGVTTAVTLGSFAVAGIAALGLGVGTPGQALTSTSSNSDDGGTSLGQVPIRGDDREYGGSSSGGGSVQSGNGGSISGKSAGS